VTVAGTTEGTRAEVLDALRQGDRFVLVTHEHPDGDALGSLVAMQGVMRALGKDALTFIGRGEFPLPYEYAFFQFEDLISDMPADIDERTIVFLDCGNVDRNAVEIGEAPILNLDHHHDNTHFGTINHVVADASCTAEIVWDLMRGLDVALTPTVAEALYVGLVTDTGRFMYENTTPAAHRMAADLIDAGVDVHGVYRRVYEDLPFRRLQLLSRALSSVERYDEGAITVGILTRSDFEETGALETDSEGIVDNMRAVEGTAVAVLVRELLGEGREGSRKVSLRATDGRVDVSRIARSLGGGGHRQAAGFSTDLPLLDLLGNLRAGVESQLEPRGAPAT